MAANTSPIFEKDPFVKGYSLVPADTTTKKTLIAAADIPAEGLRIDQISLTNTETASSTIVQFYWSDGSSDFLIATVVVPANAGFDGTVPMVDAMPLLAPSLGYLTLQDADLLKVAATVTIDSGKQVDVVARGGKLTA